MSESTAPVANVFDVDEHGILTGFNGIPLTQEGADQIHSITIGDYNTWTTFHLIPKTRPLVKPPEPQTEFVDIPGSDSPLDYTQAIDGNVHYKMRTGTWEFIAPPDGYSAPNRQSRIMRFIGKDKVAVTLNDDPDYYYVGRVWLTDWKSEDQYSTLTFKYQLEPYKVKASDETIRRL